MKKIVMICMIAATFGSCKKADDSLPASANAVDAKKPVAGFKINNLINGSFVTEGKNLKIENLSQNAVSYMWDFGNGLQFNSTAPGKVYYVPCGGTYTISLTAYNSAGEKSVYTKNITVLCSGKNSHNQHLDE